MLDVIGRLADGAGFDQARSEMDTIAGRLAAAYPGTNRDGASRSSRSKKPSSGPA